MTLHWHRFTKYVPGTFTPNKPEIRNVIGYARYECRCGRLRLLDVRA